MKLVRCNNGHFYDSDKYSQCPDCGETSLGGQGDAKPHAGRYYTKVLGVEPVVGWLVCTGGEYFGESFNLKSGRNFIGRSFDMDVVLCADAGVSQNNHAVVNYEARKRIFTVQPGDSGEEALLNGKAVTASTQMRANDVLSVGTTRLMLIPCCGPEFSWEDIN